MGIIEQAAKRIEQLQRAGVDVPWEAAGMGPDEQAKLTQAAAKPQASPAAPPAAQPTQDAGDEVTIHLPPLDEDLPQAGEPAEEAAQDTHSRVRRSREVQLNLTDLMRRGYLVPGMGRSKQEEEFRIVKRPLLHNCDPALNPPIARANLIMVTSALPGEGKTYCAINLAMSMAMELDHTVLLVDADVVRPSVLNRLGLAPTRGLMDVLDDPTLDLSEVLLKTNIPKLTLLPAGTAHQRSTELLASTSMESLLDELATLYSDRIVIFDAPPLLPSTESRVLATNMGQVLVVVEANQTPRATVDEAFATLDECPVVHAMLNKNQLDNGPAGYGYYAAP